MVRRAADVRRALVAQQRQQRVEQADHRADVPAVRSRAPWARGVVGPEQLVRGVDEVELHRPTLAARPDAVQLRDGRRSDQRLTAGRGHLVEGALAVARRQIHRPDRVEQDRRLVAQPHAVEGRGLDAVVGRQPAARPGDVAPRRPAIASQLRGDGPPPAGSRIEKPE